MKLDYKCFLCGGTLKEPHVDIRPLIESTDGLPTSITILPRLRRLLADENCNIDNVTPLIVNDPSLSSGIIKIGNSSFYSGMTPCSTLEEALNRIGFAETYKFVALTASRGILQKNLVCYNIKAEELWRSSVQVGHLTEYLTKRIVRNSLHKEFDMPEISTAYLIGLLHPIVIDYYHQENELSLPSVLDDDNEKMVLGYTGESSHKLLTYCKNGISLVNGKSTKEIEVTTK